MAQARPDFICIDWEHGQIARDTIENLVRASDVHGVPAMVRVPGHAPEEIAAALDSGAQGILVPRVSTAAQAAAPCEGLALSTFRRARRRPGRAAGYGYRIFDYLAEANASIVVAVQVETAEGLANVDAIAATEGVEWSSSARATSPCRSTHGPDGAAALAKAIGKIIAATLKRGKTSGIFCGKPEDVGTWAEKGASFFILASDTMFLGAGTATAWMKRASR